MNNSVWLWLGLIICIVTAALAARKGYSFYLWFLAGGIIGLVILAFLPFVNKGNLSEIEVRERTKTGNIIGGVLTALALIQIVPALFILGLAASKPKMSGVIIDGRELTQKEWDACGRNTIRCLEAEVLRPKR